MVLWLSYFRDKLEENRNSVTLSSWVGIVGVGEYWIMSEFKGPEKVAFAVGLAIALSIDVIMNFLYFFGIVS